MFCFRHIIYIGHSAGAHLITCTIERVRQISPSILHRIKDIFLICGIYDLSEVRHTSINADNILSLDNANTVLHSPLLSIDFRTWSKFGMRINVCVSENDSKTFKEQSQKLYDRMIECEMQTTLQMIDGCDHFDIVERLSDASFELSQLIVVGQFNE